MCKLFSSVIKQTSMV